MPNLYTILVVDDSPESLHLILRMFDEAIYEVLTAVDGPTAIKQAEEMQPDLILLDIMMPEMNGFETCYHLKKNQITKEIPIIFMTALLDMTNKLEGFRLGAVDYVTKPFDISELLARVSSHIKLSSLQKQLRAKNQRLSAEIERRKQAERDLRAAHHRLEQQSTSRIQAIVDNTADGIITTDEDGNIESFNRAAERIFGYQSHEVIGQNMVMLMPSTYWQGNQRSLQFPSLYTSQSQGLGRELMGLKKDGSIVAIEMTANEVTIGDRRMFIGVIRDVTERKRAQVKMLHLATHDALTNLPNRYVLQQRIKHTLQIPSTHPFALILLDCDRFKNVNDSLGHLVGDRLLVCISQRLQQTIRPNDFFARFVGDKFAILMHQLNSVSEVIEMANLILQRFTLPFEIRQRELFIGVSIGIALYKETYTSPDDIIRDADTAMYQAKKAGKGCYRIFNNTMLQRVQNILELETDLRQAWQHQTFTVHYQPIVDLQTGRLYGFEALTRWYHPTRGYIAPDNFIPLAEEIGLIVPLGQWVLYEACQQLRIWQALHPEPLSISVNISTSQFNQPHLFSYIDSILAETGLSGHQLHLEITESLLMDNIAFAIELLKKLKERDIYLSIDDFGTGYSSFSYLQQLPVDILKIDRSFINQVKPDGQNTTIIESIIDLAHNLNLAIIAEGIETYSQMQMIKNWGGEYGQGYYFAKAFTTEQVQELLKQPPHWLVDETFN